MPLDYTWGYGPLDYLQGYNLSFNTNFLFESPYSYINQSIPYSTYYNYPLTNYAVFDSSWMFSFNDFFNDYMFIWLDSFSPIKYY